ncbi:MAG: GerMN domain-containing protein [Clostridiaceae bacterium]|nr:GerMN domain-containing protein [Eubacteriales bacterium]
MKRYRFATSLRKLLALALAAALLSGCMNTGEVSGELTLSTDMPPVLSQDENRESSFEARLYFVSEDGRNLSAETREIGCNGSMSRAEAAIRAMEDGPVSEALHRSIPQTLRFTGIELSRDACNVYFNGMFQEIREWLILRAAVSATVYAAESISAVNIYLNGTEPGYEGRPLGALAPLSGALDTYLSDLKQQYEVLPQEHTEAGSLATNTATFYFANIDDTLLIARTRKVAYDLSVGKAGIVKLLLGELLQGDAGSKGLEPVLPADLQLAEDPAIVYLNDLGQSAQPQPSATPTGGAEEPPLPGEPTVTPQDRDEPCIIELVFQPPAMEYDEGMMCGAITLMLTGYLPKVRGVKISIAETDADGVTAERSLSQNEYFTRAEFTGRIGHGIYLAFPDAESAVLDRVKRMVASASVYDPDARLAELFKGPADPAVMHPLFSASDVLDVYIINDLAVVNWRAGFTEKLAELSEMGNTDAAGGNQMKLFIFGVINTLTEIPGVERVWMLEDGKKLESVNELYLGNALLRNPGILISVSTS